MDATTRFTVQKLAYIPIIKVFVLFICDKLGFGFLALIWVLGIFMPPRDLRHIKVFGVITSNL